MSVRLPLYLPGSIASLVLLFASHAAAQNVSTTPSNNDDQLIEEIVVTGSRIARRDTTAPSPIATINRDKLLLAPQPTLEETLNRLPQFTPDLGRNSNNPGDGTSQLNLRGMGSERTLVLLNSRRIAPSGTGSAVDINNIPQALIDRVEIITGGATAVYGSDALAGVVNFITRDDFEGIELEANYGVTDRGDASYTDINLAFGADIGRGSAVAYAGYYERESLLAAARSHTRETLQEDGSGDLFSAGSFTVPEGVLFNFIPGLGFPIFNTDGTPRPFVNPDDQYNYAPFNYLQAPLTRIHVGLLGTLEISDNYEIYTEAMFANNEAATELAPVPMLANVQINTDNPVLAPATAQLLQDNFTDPNSANPLLATVRASRRMSELGSRVQHFERDYLRAVLGVRGELGNGWILDGHVSYTNSDEETLLLNDGSRSRLLQGLLVDPQTGQCFDPTGGCVPVDIFGADRLSAAAVDYLRYAPLLNTTERTQTLASVFVSGSPAETWAGDVDMAAGLEWRRDKVDFKADDALFTFDTLVYRGNAPVNGSESVAEAYAEAVLPLLDAVPAADALALELGARYSSFDNADDAWTYKAGINWQLNDAIRFRSMWQRSVRAPNNEELFQEMIHESSVFVGNITAVDPCSASENPVANGYTEAWILHKSVCLKPFHCTRLIIFAVVTGSSNRSTRKP